MSDDQDGCEWVNVSSGTGSPGVAPDKGLLNGGVCACVRVYMRAINFLLRNVTMGATTGEGWWWWGAPNPPPQKKNWAPLQVFPSFFGGGLMGVIDCAKLGIPF